MGSGEHCCQSRPVTHERGYISICYGNLNFKDSEAMPRKG